MSSKLAAALCWLALVTASRAAVVSIRGDRFLIDGEPTYSDALGADERIRGLLMGVCATQALFDDENPPTRGEWRYPDGTAYSADRQTDELIAALTSYRRHGVIAVRINLQGDTPKLGDFLARQQWISSAFAEDGSLKSAYAARLERLLVAADERGMVVIVGLFYQGQDQRLRDERAVRNAIVQATGLLARSGRRNVMIEIAGDSGLGFDHAILRPARVHEAIRLARQTCGGAVPVSCGFMGGRVPPRAAIQAGDFVMLNGTGQSTTLLRRLVGVVRRQTDKPILFGVGSTSIDSLQAAIDAGASWSFLEQGRSGYSDGFQTPPTNWQINTDTKKAYFGKVAELAGLEPGDEQTGP